MSSVKKVFVLFCVFFAGYLLAAVDMSANSGSQYRIISGTNVRVRDIPETKGNIVSELALGVLVKVTETASAEEKIGGLTGRWYKVEYGVDGIPKGTGWIFGAYSLEYDKDQKSRIGLSIIEKNLSKASQKPDELGQLLRFAERVPPGTDPEVSLPLKMSYLKALQQYLLYSGTNTDEKVKSDPFLKNAASMIVFSEPAGAFFVKPECFWELYEKSAKLKCAEKIARGASEALIPGESEGYMPAVFSRMVYSKIRYLQAFPKGEHSKKIVDEIYEHLKNLITYFKEDAAKLPAEDLPELKTNIKKVRDALSASDSPRKTDTIKQLDQISGMIK
ncbi:MAG: SH3 domain-containing protein [Candidatus Riflebacteria bacterium]|nr:SH3 domain-containing protein [Candidatus Riflebacteria bacterium]